MKEDSDDEKGEQVVPGDEDNVKANCVDKNKILWDYKMMSFKMLQGFRIEEGKHFSNCKDHKEQIVIIVTGKSKKIS